MHNEHLSSHRIASHRIAPHRTTPHRTAPHRIASQTNLRCATYDGRAGMRDDLRSLCCFAKWPRTEPGRDSAGSERREGPSGSLESRLPDRRVFARLGSAGLGLHHLELQRILQRPRRRGYLRRRLRGGLRRAARRGANLAGNLVAGWPGEAGWPARVAQPLPSPKVALIVKVTIVLAVIMH